MTWASLNFEPEFTATASNIGFGWWSHDIGAHLGGYKASTMLNDPGYALLIQHRMKNA